VTNAALFDVDKTHLPMLEAVGRPRIINPDLRRRRLAKQRGYPIEAWT
jgi:phosphoserine phosphatase